MNEIELSFKNTLQSKNFDDTYEEYGDYMLWDSPIVTYKENYHYHKNITPEEVEQFVKEYLSEKYHIFYSGKVKVG